MLRNKNESIKKNVFYYIFLKTYWFALVSLFNVIYILISIVLFINFLKFFQQSISHFFSLFSKFKKFVKSLFYSVDQELKQCSICNSFFCNVLQVHLEQQSVLLEYYNVHVKDLLSSLYLPIAFSILSNNILNVTTARDNVTYFSLSKISDNCLNRRRYWKNFDNIFQSFSEMQK